MRGAVFPAPARRGLNSGGVCQGAKLVLAVIFEQNNQLYSPID